MSFQTVFSLPGDAIGNFTGIVDLALGGVVITTVDAVLHNIYINEDFSNDTVDIDDGSINRFVMPRKSLAGSSVTFDSPLMIGGITVLPAGVPTPGIMTGGIIVCWSPAPHDVASLLLP